MTRPLEFGQYVLHLTPLSLFEGARKIVLPRRQLEVLALIVAAKGDSIAREDFFKKIWRDSCIDDSNLTQAIFLLRRALGKLPNGAEFIETVPRVGYRLSSALTTHAPIAVVDLDALVTDSENRLSQIGSLEHLRLLVDSLDEYAIYMLDRAGRIVTCNQGGEWSTGYIREEVEGRHFSIFFAAEDINSRIPDLALSRARRIGKSVSEGWRVKKTGERFWAYSVISSMLAPNGRLIGFSKIVRDYTRQKKQEEAQLKAEALLRMEKDRLHAAVERNADALCICSNVLSDEGEVDDYLLTYLNPALEQLFSISREALLGSTVRELLSTDQAEQFFDECSTAALSGMPTTAETVVHFSHSLSRHLRLQISPFEGGIAIAITDITQTVEDHARVTANIGSSKLVH